MHFEFNNNISRESVVETVFFVKEGNFIEGLLNLDLKRRLRTTE